MIHPLRLLRKLLWQHTATFERTARLDRGLEQMREALGRIEARQSAANPSMALRDHEFRVSSQWGEDGIIEHLVTHVETPCPYFVEFGIEDYSEANTRFLLTHRRWSGLVLDASEECLARLREQPLMWRHDLTAVRAFIDRDNIDGLLSRHGRTGPIGLLSIDVDGNDYWIWEAIHVVQPAIVVVEYNAIFGPDRAVTIPYDAGFQREMAHYSCLYFGASLRALVRLGRRKGYAFVGTNSAGNNAFFIERARLPAGLRELTVEEGFTPAQFREARHPDGSLAFTPAQEAFELIRALPLVEVPE